MNKILIHSVASAATSSSATAKVGVKAGVLDGVLGASPMVQLLLLIMIGLSVICWAIIFTKYKQYRLLSAANDLFNERFWKANSLESVYERLGDYASSNCARVFKAAFHELQRVTGSTLSKHRDQTLAETRAHISGLDNLERTLRKAIDAEVAVVESRLGFLATTGSTAPFIGLLGTVVGIMTSFSQIAMAGSASLAVVAPGISEALFLTAVGLFAALPAVAAYNYFVGQVKRLEMDLNSFASDFLNIAKRTFFKDE